MYDQRKVESIVREIKQISKEKQTLLKTKILELAKEVEKGILEKNPYLLAKINTTISTGPLRNAEISPKLVSAFIKRLRNEHFDSISIEWINKCLPEKFKWTYETVDKSQIIEISDAQLYDMKDDLKNRIRRIEHEGIPAKPIKYKDTKASEFEKYTWTCYLAQELARLAINMEKEHHTHDASLCAKYAKYAKMARDGRFATTLNKYEAMIVAAESTTSLANVVEGSWEFKTRWEIEEDERNCKECLSHSDCAVKKCKHICHNTVKPMTTKGLKYAIKTDNYLKDLNQHMKQLMTMDNDICSFAKIILENKETGKFLTKIDKKRVMASHIDKDECFQCRNFLDDHPKFFD